MKPFIKWAGGKRWLADHELFNNLAYTGKYLEPFFGGGAMYFHLKPERSIVSDVNTRLIEAYRAVRNDPEIVISLLKDHQILHSKEYYYKIRKTSFDDLNRRAAQFIYLNRTCWNGLYRENLAGEFNVPIGTKKLIFDPTEDFIAISKQLKKSEILSCDFEQTIDLAEAGDFVFCDPPYTTAHNLNGFVKYNQNIFSWKDQVRLRDAAVRAMRRGAIVVITNADHPSLHELYQAAEKIDTMERASVISGKSTGRGMTSEILVTL
ncbi:DNA adenine methylase [Blastomonas fulva]|uniref:Site-specific DNA-methyltransferase (adenine-specific) n=1 Tax=Blastomonas fulva TaxID=1550728 RepID=A0ABM6M2H0_9SPHN|nr:Dam family site-specific DNA-(adenine-N6)-methyltransferase [Blastomonas fulva]ASR50071.1 DNA methyltransferase [Blastomonas fulva]